RVLDMLIEERDRILDRLQHARGLGFEREHDVFVLTDLDLAEALEAALEVAHDRLVEGSALTKCDWHRADRSMASQRQKVREQIDQQDRIRGALGLVPVGSVNVLLHARVVKRAVWKPVDREDVQVVRLEKVAELRERTLRRELVRRARRQ